MNGYLLPKILFELQNGYVVEEESFRICSRDKKLLFMFEIAV